MRDNRDGKIKYFMPSSDLTRRILEASPDDLSATFESVKGNDMVVVAIDDIRDEIGRKLEETVGTMAYRAGAREENILIVGENNNFTDEFVSMLSSLGGLPLDVNSKDKLYSALYQEFYEHVVSGGHNGYDFGKMVVDSGRFHVVNLARTRRLPAVGPRAKVISPK